MNKQNMETHHGALEKILHALGLKTDQMEPAAETEGYRIQFEQNFTIEIQEISTQNCRVSARIFSLGKSLQVQDNQIKMALNLFSELRENIPNGISAAISDHDNCLRLCAEIVNDQTEALLGHFQTFTHIAFAYKQTYFKHRLELG